MNKLVRERSEVRLICNSVHGLTRNYILVCTLHLERVDKTLQKIMSTHNLSHYPLNKVRVLSLM